MSFLEHMCLSYVSLQKPLGTFFFFFFVSLLVEKLPIFHVKLLFSITHLTHFQGSFYVIIKCLVSRRFINLCEALSLFRGIIADEPICSLFISIFHVYVPFLCLAVYGRQRGAAIDKNMAVLAIVKSEENRAIFETWKMCCYKHGNDFEFRVCELKWWKTTTWIEVREMNSYIIHCKGNKHFFKGFNCHCALCGLP